MRFNEPRRGFTLVEVLIVVAIIAMLAALLLPVVNVVRDRARQTQCMSRMRNIGFAYVKARENKPAYRLKPDVLQPDSDPSLDPNVPDDAWKIEGPLKAELQGEEDVWICPSAEEGTNSFGFSQRLTHLGDRDAPRIAILDYGKRVAEVVGHPVTDTWTDQAPPRHGERVNVFTGAHATAEFEPDAIDPAFCWNQEEYWLPATDREKYVTWGPTAGPPAAAPDEVTYPDPSDDPYYEKCDSPY